MEKSKEIHSENNSPVELPVLINYISTNGLDGFDSVKEDGQHSLNHLTHVAGKAVSESPKTVHFNAESKHITENQLPGCAAIPESAEKQQAGHGRFYSQPIPKGSSAFSVAASNANSASGTPKSGKLKDKRFDTFKTWSGKLERQLTNLGGRQREPIQDSDAQTSPEIGTITVDRYFDALEDPELNTLRASEISALPEDQKWPFLLRFPISSFGICLGVSSQAIMWKALATDTSTRFLHISPDVNLVLWCISVALVAIVALIYGLKIVFYFEAVRREYYHPVRVNFFFAPWIALLFLAMGVPPSITENLHKSLWYILMTPILCLELKIYGQWMSGGQRRLSKVANPSNHLSVVGNFVGALLGATMGLKEGPIFFFAVGLAHYSVLFVTLYQRLPTNETLPKELHPVFFLFVAAPSVASMAWAKIQGSFDFGSKIAYFIALFLYVSLAVRINFFRGFNFSLAWWAYTFPMTGAAIATIRYSSAISTTVSKILAVIFCAISTLAVTALLVTTIIHAFVLRDLFPNDSAIAVSERRPKTQPRWYHRRGGSSDHKDIIDQYLKVVDSAVVKDIEAALSPPNVVPQ
ncbi:S-type anion channel SLAH2-like [Ipomoea triloba]|uniref:S-type anion channel SLAH2-like n=1 Tax=Ipomoea triloba TaxID=35885 RepID=UPI00125CFDAA|nr:S-type anion channel SLAH2-like [Ipomoea triloba]